MRLRKHLFLQKYALRSSDETKLHLRLSSAAAASNMILVLQLSRCDVLTTSGPEPLLQGED